MKIEEILKKQGKIYSKLPKNEVIEEFNEKIKKPDKELDEESIDYRKLSVEELEEFFNNLPKIIEKEKEYALSTGCCPKDEVTELISGGISYDDGKVREIIRCPSCGYTTHRQASPAESRKFFRRIFF